MSTPSRSDTKTAAKRRAAARQRRRVLLRQIGAIFFVGIFVLGTATTIFVAQTASQSSNTASTVPTQAPTEAAGAAVTQLQQQAQQAEAKQDWAAASGYYLAAADLSPSNATLHYGAGKALINKGDITKGVTELQKALDLNPDATSRYLVMGSGPASPCHGWSPKSRSFSSRRKYGSTSS